MSDLKFRNFGNGVIIEDGSKKGFGAIKPRTKNRVGDKYIFKINTGYIPISILNDKKRRDAKTLGREYNPSPLKDKTRKVQSIPVKTMAEGKKLANTIKKMGGSGMSDITPKAPMIDMIDYRKTGMFKK
jgi:hypothetical protein